METGWLQILSAPPFAYASLQRNWAKHICDGVISESDRAVMRCSTKCVSEVSRLSQQTHTNFSDHPQKICTCTHILQSQQTPDRFYISSTSDLKRRLTEHNSGKSIHTNKFLPWKIKNYVAFEDEFKATEFEKFLKSGNGKIFAKKHF
jgi:putative endonuclease